MTTPPGPRYERRSERRTRFAAGCACLVIAPPDFRCRAATIADVARSGLGLVVSEPIPVGTTVALRPDGPLDLDRVLGMRVRHATQLPDGRWLLGCARARDLTDDVLRVLLQALRPAN